MNSKVRDTYQRTGTMKAQTAQAENTADMAEALNDKVARQGDVVDEMRERSAGQLYYFFSLFSSRP